MGYNHRQVWFAQFARFVGFPTLALALILRLAAALDASPKLLEYKLITGLLYFLSIPIFWSIRNVLATAAQSREAAKLGGREVPRVQGRWPGNVDVMLRQAPTPTLLDVTNPQQNGHLSPHGLRRRTQVPIHPYPQPLTRFQYGKSSAVARTRAEDSQIVTVDHEVIKFMLATGFTSFGKGPKQQARLESFLGDGIFNRDGELWKFHRNMTRPFFVRERVTDFDLFDKYTQKLIGRVAEHADQGVAMDLQDLFARLTMDAAGEFLFSSTSINSLDMDLPIAGKAKIGPRGTAVESMYGGFVNAFDEVQVLIPVRGRMGPYVWPLVEMRGDKAMKHRKVIDAWLQPLLDSAFDRRREYVNAGGDSKTPAGETFLDDLVSSTDDRSLIADELTAALLTFTVYLFTQHPEVLAKLRTEVLEHVGAGAPTYGEVKGMKYIRAVLNETLRLFPPVPINERASTVGVAIPTAHGKLYVPPNTQVLYSPILMQRRTDLWGPDAHEFDPERWLDDRNRAFLADPMRFVPFNAGPRICLGQQFALNEASFVLVRLLQRFERFDLAMDAAPASSAPPAEWSGADGRKGFERVWPKNAVTLYSKGGMWVKAFKAQ